MIAREDRIIVAVSGGIDSAVLLHLLAGERSRWDTTLCVAHFNHGLRGADADADEAFVRQLAADHGLPFVAGREDVRAIAASRGSGIEEAARARRYAFLEHQLTLHSCTRCATGHNADDNAETVLFHLFRGSGLRGLAGIPVSRNNGRIIRPLLFATRSEIAAFAAAEGIRYREDSTNASGDHTRNIIRHHLLPVIRERIQPDVAHTILRTSALARTVDGWLTDTARHALTEVLQRRTGEEVLLPLSLLTAQPEAVRSAMLMLAIEETTGLRPGFDATQRVIALTGARTGATVPVHPGWEACRLHDAVRIGRVAEADPFACPVTPGTTIDVPGGRFVCERTTRAAFDAHPRPAGEYVDAARTGSEGLVLRSWRSGDRLMPLGMRQQKKLSDLFTDAGIPAFAKHRHPVLTAADGTIIWVCGLRIDERFKITDSTRDVLRLQFHISSGQKHGEATQGQR